MTRRNAVSDKIRPQRHEVAVDFSLWDFCPWVRTARSFVAARTGSKRQPEPLATSFPSNKTESKEPGKAVQGRLLP